MSTFGKPDGYMTTPEWSELVDATVLGRPIKVWRKRPRSVVELMALSVGRDEDHFMVQGERRFTFAEFRTAVEVGAAQLAASGLRVGDRLLIVLYNSPEFWLVQCAAWRLGAVPVLGNRWWGQPDFAAAIARIQPAFVATDMILTDAVRPCITPAQIAEWWKLQPPTVSPPHPSAAQAEDDVAVIVFTAGSTGAPKSVQLSHRALVWTQQTIQVLRGARPPVTPAAGQQKVALATTPLFHNGGMVATLGSQIDGSRVVFPKGRFDPAEVMHLIETEHVSSWSAVPTMFNRLLRHPALEQHNLSSLVAPASGGSAVTAEFLETLAHKLPNTKQGFSSGYGMTELSFLTMVNAADLIQRGTVGRLVPGVEMRVAEPDAQGEGEILARSGALMVGYLDGPNDQLDENGWYRTGDRGKIDAEGFVYITGRSKDMVIRGGENISCQHVETALLAHSDISEAAVFGVPDQEFGEIVVAVLYLRAGASLPDSELTAYAKAHLAYFEVPTRWICLESPLPILPTGKIDKATLRRFCHPA